MFSGCFFLKFFDMFFVEFVFCWICFFWICFLECVLIMFECFCFFWKFVGSMFEASWKYVGFFFGGMCLFFWERMCFLGRDVFFFGRRDVFFLGEMCFFFGRGGGGCVVLGMMCLFRGCGMCFWGVFQCPSSVHSINCSNWEYLHPFSTGRAVQAFSRAHSQSSRFFHSYHLYHSYLQDSLHIFRGSWVLISIRHLVEDLIEMFLLVVCNVTIRLVHVNADLFHFETVDQLWMLSRLFLDVTIMFATTCLTSLAVLWALSIVFRVRA